MKKWTNILILSILILLFARNLNLETLGVLSLISIVIGYIIFHHFSKKAIIKEQKTSEKELFKAMISAEERERSRVVGKLNESLGQMLSTTKLHLSSLDQKMPKQDEERLENAMNLIDESVMEIRALSHNLIPTSLTRGGLISAIKDLRRQIRRKENIEFELIIEPAILNFPHEFETHLYRIISELINNIIQHAQCSKIYLNLAQIDTQVKIIIRDNGRGFNFDLAIQRKNGLGWNSILGRIKLLEGAVSVNSNESEGTKIQLTIPLPSDLKQ